MKYIKTCTFCGSSYLKTLFPVNIKEKQSYVVKCDSCSLSFLNPQLEQEEINSLYQDNYFKDYIKPETLQKIEQNGLRIFKRLEKYIPDKGKILDIGAASGSYLAAFQKLGWDVQGIEISKYVRSIAKKTYGLSLFPDIKTANFPENYFDLIIMIQFIEHVSDPLELISSLYPLVKPGAILFISTPNFNSHKAKKMKDQWPSLKPGEHLHFFTPKTLREMIIKSGFKILKTETRQPLITIPQLTKVFGSQKYNHIASFVDRFFPNIKELIRSYLGKIYEGEAIEITAIKEKNS